jgi:hypothetical protein
MVIMRKHVSETSRAPQSLESKWLNLEELAAVEVTSEDPAHPIEAALVPSSGTEEGWRAGQPGEQTIRLMFDQPQRVDRIRLNMVERDVERTQEFVLKWSPDGRSFNEIVRQQWNFNPRGSTREVEEYTVNLSSVSVIELSIVPDKSGGPAVASIAEFQVA